MAGGINSQSSDPRMNLAVDFDFFFSDQNISDMNHSVGGDEGHFSWITQAVGVPNQVIEGFRPNDLSDNRAS